MGRFENLEQAERAVHTLLDNHVPSDAISVMARSDGEMVERGLAYESGVATGALAGGTLGTILGLLGASVVATGTLGPLGVPAIIVGAASAGSVGGAATGLSWWSKTAMAHADAFDDDTHVWLVVRHPTLAQEAKPSLEEAGATSVLGIPDPVEEASEESFPASDPPSFNPGRA